MLVLAIGEPDIPLAGVIQNGERYGRSTHGGVAADQDPLSRSRVGHDRHPHPCRTQTDRRVDQDMTDLRAVTRGKKATLRAGDHRARNSAIVSPDVHTPDRLPAKADLVAA